MGETGVVEGGRMKVGDLIRIKEGCDSGGKIGVILDLESVHGHLCRTIGFPDGVEDINIYWIEVIDGTHSN